MSIWWKMHNWCRRLLLPLLLRLAKSKYDRLFRSGGRVFRLTSRTVLKTGPAWQILAEADAMRLVATHTTIPIPVLYDVWTRKDEGFLVIEYIDGQNLQRTFKPVLTDAQRRHVCRTIISYVEQLRLIPQPPRSDGCSPGWIGSANSGTFCEYSLSMVDPVPPFPTLKAFNDWRISIFDKFVRRHPPTGVRLAELRAMIPDDERVVFTHADLHMMNIIVRVHGQEPEDVQVAAVLDWGCAGWRPLFWEARKIMWLAPSMTLWHGELYGPLGGLVVHEREIEIANVAGGRPPV